MQLRTPRVLAVLLTLASGSILGAQAPTPPSRFVVPAWAFPYGPAPDPNQRFDSVTKHRVPGSTRAYTMAQAKNGFDAVDWFPHEHPSMPTPVRNGVKSAWRACGFCHLPDGRGRPENATLAGLPVDYIQAQVQAFAEKTRLAAVPATGLTSMHQIATAALASPSDVAIAAQYFSKLKYTRRNTIVESDSVPTTRVEFIIYARDGTGKEPIGGRLIEVPEDFERHELRDAHLAYTTYVPVGSIARGRKLATAGPNGIATACATCHGPTLRGVGVVPPIAGRSPSYILRQLMNLKAGTRHDAGSVPMLAVVETLTVDDMVALAAYVGSRAP
jgi:cytochrome c553